MAIIVDQVRTHEDTNTGDDTVPPGITGLDWCHLVSTVSELELTTFLTLNVLTIGCLPTNVRTPLLGSISTYCGLNEVQRAAAVLAGATPQRQQFVQVHSFDSVGTAPFYEP